MNHLFKICGILGAMILAVAALSACSVSVGGGGDGKIHFGTGLNSDHHVTGERSTFSGNDQISWAGDLKDGVAKNTITLKLIDPAGKTVSSGKVGGGSDQVNKVWDSSPLSASALASQHGGGTYKLEALSGGKVEASGTFTVSGSGTTGQSSSQASSQASSSP